MGKREKKTTRKVEVDGDEIEINSGKGDRGNLSIDIFKAVELISTYIDINKETIKGRRKARIFREVTATLVEIRDTLRKLTIDIAPMSRGIKLSTYLTEMKINIWELYS